MPIIKIRRGTTTQWNASSRVLQVGELGIDTTLNRIKAGNGVGVWSALPYLSLSSAEIEELSQDSVAAALAAGTHSNITVTYSDNGNSISLATGPDVITQTSLSNTLTDATTGYVSIGDVGVADGVASLDSNGKIPDSEIPDTIARDSEIPSLTGYATETYVTTAISNLVDTAPTTLNTLNELAAAINDDASFASTVTTALGTKAATSDVAELAQDAVGNSLSNLFVYNDSTGGITLDNAKLSDFLMDGASGNSYGLIGTSAYLDVKNTNGYNKEIELDITALESKLDTDGYIKQSALDAKLDKITSMSSKSSSYTLQTTDIGTLIEMSAGGTLTITDSSSFSVGFTVDILQTGSSQVTIAGTSFTPNATPGLKLRTQWSSATLIKRGLNSWVVLGDLSA
jgi:hypothetical protein